MDDRPSVKVPGYEVLALLGPRGLRLLLSLPLQGWRVGPLMAFRRDRLELSDESGLLRVGVSPHTHTLHAQLRG